MGHLPKAKARGKHWLFLGDLCLQLRTHSGSYLMISFKDKQKPLHQRLRLLRANATWAEKVFRDKLEKLGVRYIFQKGFIQGSGYCIAAFYFPRLNKLVVEIDGASHLSRKEYDARRDNYLKNRGMKVIRITNEEAIKMPLNEVNSLFPRRPHKINLHRHPSVV